MSSSVEKKGPEWLLNALSYLGCTVGRPEVTSAHFAGSHLLLVVNQRVYMYNYKAGLWNTSEGMLVGMFAYSDHPLNRSLGLAFDYNETLEVLIPPGQRGLLILWSQNNLFLSLNAGQIVETIQVQKGGQTLHPSIFGANITIHTIAAYENGLAVLTREDHLYYGSLGVLSGSSSIIKVGKLQILTPLPDAASPVYDFQKCVVNIQATLMDPDLHVEKCKIELMYGNFEGKMYTMDMNSQLEVTAVLIPRPDASLIPQASQVFLGRLAWRVMVSNPYSLGLKTSIYESDNTYEGNVLYKLYIRLKQQHHWGWFDPNFTSSIKRPTMSTLTVDIANKEISCVDLKPLTALISIGCDREKKLIVQNKISACSAGVLDPRVLQDNYTYVIKKGSYDLGPGRESAKGDLLVSYPFKDFGCPGLVYYETPWKPVIELWHGNEFAELVEAEFVLREVHGLRTFSYALTAKDAGCRSQPQNWSSVLQSALGSGRAPWSRESYVSCHSPSSQTPLRWPDVQYQILGGRTDNRVIFKQWNGIYVFHLSVLDPYYSYCRLETTFSIYVYGAYPLSLFAPGVTIVLLVASMLLAIYCRLETTFSIYVYGAYPLSLFAPGVTIVLLVARLLLAMWLAHILPKLLCAHGGLKIKEAYRELRRRCHGLCHCCRGRQH
ncbi:Transmembrane protein 146 [Heterocephalus glaber]|uniref:Cation channel sperm-associated auxiliary subunit delta n=1 Tax=Heterocephalus glaber TaxID=10181 RepID=G5C0Q4_HETGA|nr:Transmembrane protein 146 [Heterocephalus glaber]